MQPTIMKMAKKSGPTTVVGVDEVGGMYVELVVGSEAMVTMIVLDTTFPPASVTTRVKLYTPVPNPAIG